MHLYTFLTKKLRFQGILELSFGLMVVEVLKLQIFFFVFVVSSVVSSIRSFFVVPSIICPKSFKRVKNICDLSGTAFMLSILLIKLMISRTWNVS